MWNKGQRRLLATFSLSTLGTLGVLGVVSVAAINQFGRLISNLNYCQLKLETNEST